MWAGRISRYTTVCTAKWTLRLYIIGGFANVTGGIRPDIVENVGSETPSSPVACFVYEYYFFNSVASCFLGVVKNVTLYPAHVDT